MSVCIDDNLDVPLAELGHVWYRSFHPERVLATTDIETVWREVWFAKGDEQVIMDSKLKRFESLWSEKAVEFRSGAWRPIGVLETIEAIILFDQVPRNIFRGTAKAYMSDDLGYVLAHSVYTDSHFHSLPVHLQYTVIIALVHSEKMIDQEKVLKFADKLPSTLIGDRFRAIANNHRDRIVLFGRFPERNSILGRTSTDKEVAYMSSIVA
jgi:uncharacterized protein (DUF924 family)